MAGATFVPEVDYVHRIGCVEWVNGMDTIFPDGYLPSKENNYEEGGKIHIPSQSGRYTAAYIPSADCQLKKISLAFSAYNLEDTFDILVGNKYVVRNSPVIEMADIKNLELYVDVPAGTPIIIAFNNYSGTEKYMFYSISTLTDAEFVEDILTFNWYFYWSGYDTLMPENSSFSYSVDSPNYFNSNNTIKDVGIVVGSLQEHRAIANITWTPIGGTVSNYIETDPFYASFNPLARDRSIVLTAMNVSDRKITFTFRNVTMTSTGVNDSRIGMDLNGTILSEYY